MSQSHRSPDARRGLPSVDTLLGSPVVIPWIERWGRVTVRESLRRILAGHRASISAGGIAPEADVLLTEILADLQGDRPALRTVLNGTGVILHTNLGRAPLATSAARAAAEVASCYSSLEYDVASGSRGDRYAHCAELLCRLTGSEDALVVNNNAAAISLAINELARGRDVVVSRGELVEIGGGFRIPEVIERSGGFVAAVGSTNKTRIEDYRRAITPSTGLLLKVHPSNYTVQGFTEEARLADLVALGRRTGVPVLHDVGSGLILPEGLVITMDDPTPSGSAALGADLITWSGDKLFGGPQAGLLHGRTTIVERLRSNPLLRAFRVDKMTLAALEETLRMYRDPDRALREIPALRMLADDASVVRERARLAHAQLGSASDRVRVVALESVVGGGSAPGRKVESAGWALEGSAPELDQAFRALRTPLVGRVQEDRFTIDFRTILPGEEKLVVQAVADAFCTLGDP